MFQPPYFQERTIQRLLAPGLDSLLLPGPAARLRAGHEHHCCWDHVPLQNSPRSNSNHGFRYERAELQEDLPQRHEKVQVAFGQNCPAHQELLLRYVQLRGNFICYQDDLKRSGPGDVHSWVVLFDDGDVCAA